MKGGFDDHILVIVAWQQRRQAQEEKPLEEPDVLLWSFEGEQGHRDNAQTSERRIKDREHIQDPGESVECEQGVVINEGFARGQAKAREMGQTEQGEERYVDF